MADGQIMRPIGAELVTQIRQLLRYDAKTGKLYWNERPREYFNSHVSWTAWIGRYANKEAFIYTDERGYKNGAILRKPFKAHRVIWALVHGVDPGDALMDHIDGDTGNNRIENLRLVNYEGNARNRKRPNTNSSGIVGVAFYKNRNNWVASIYVRGKKVCLGYYDSKEHAIIARKAAETALSYHHNHGRA
jgi:hypothetical protein